MENNEKKKKQLSLVVIAMLVCILACIVVAGTMFGFTLARYKTDTSKNNALPVAKWGVTTEISDDLKLVGNDYVVPGKLAPATEGYVDVTIKLSETEVAVDYEIEIGAISLSTTVAGVTIGDLITIRKVVKVENGVEGAELTGAAGKYNGTIDLPDGSDGSKEAFGANDEFTARIYITWANNDENNATDTAIGTATPVTVNFTIKVDAQQHIPADDPTPTPGA